MSDKVTLLSTIPSEAKSTPVKATAVPNSTTKLISSESSAPLLKPIASNSSTGQLLSPLKPSKESTSTGESAGSITTESAEVNVAGNSSFQAVLYFSFVLSFCLAGFAAVVLLRKVAKIAEERLTKASKILAFAFVAAALHGIFATFLYTNYLRDTTSGAPLAYSMAVWMLLGPCSGIALNYLLTPKKLPQTKDLLVDAATYFVIFSFATLSVSKSINTNAALVLGLIPFFLLIVPVARQLTMLKIAKVRHPELTELPDQILFYSLMTVPCALPLISFLEMIGLLSPELTLFLFNFCLFDFLLVVGISMYVSIDNVAPADVTEAVIPEPAPSLQQESANVGTVEKKSNALGEEEHVNKPDTITFPNAPIDDPIIEFLKTQDTEAKESSSKTLPRKPASPRKLTRPAVKIDGPLPPKKPGSANGGEVAPNAPARFKAPAKPKKRF